MDEVGRSNLRALDSSVTGMECVESGEQWKWSTCRAQVKVWAQSVSGTLVVAGGHRALGMLGMLAEELVEAGTSISRRIP